MTIRIIGSSLGMEEYKYNLTLFFHNIEDVNALCIFIDQYNQGAAKGDSTSRLDAQSSSKVDFSKSPGKCPKEEEYSLTEEGKQSLRDLGYDDMEKEG